MQIIWQNLLYFPFTCLQYTKSIWKKIEIASIVQIWLKLTISVAQVYASWHATKTRSCHMHWNLVHLGRHAHKSLDPPSAQWRVDCGACSWLDSGEKMPVRSQRSREVVWGQFEECHINVHEQHIEMAEPTQRKLKNTLTGEPGLENILL